MNAFIQLLIEPKPGELRRALETLVSTLPFQGKLTAVWLNRFGKRAVKKWSTLKAEENWPVGTDELILTTDKVRVGKLLEGQLRILTIVSPHDENWGASKDTISHSLEVRGVQMNRQTREDGLVFHKAVQWPNFIQIGIGNATEGDAEKALLAVVQKLLINNIGLFYGVADLVPEDVAPVLNAHDWRQSKLLVKMNMRLPVPPEKYWLGDAFVAAHQAVCVAAERVDAESLSKKGYALASDVDHRFQIWRMPVQPNVIVTLPIPYDGRYA